MSFGLTTEGLKIKRLADIKSEIEESHRLLFGSDVNLTANTPFGQMIGIYSERESLLWELLQAIYQSAFPATSQGLSLDFLVSLTGLTRRNANSSLVVLKAVGDVGTVIPAGSTVSQLSNTDVQFSTLVEGTIEEGQDEIQTISFPVQPDDGVFRLSFDGQETPDLDFNVASSVVESALNGLSNLSAVVVTGDVASGFTVTFAGTDGRKDQPTLVSSLNSLTSLTIGVGIDIESVQTGIENRALIPAESVQTGPVVAVSGSLTQIGTPVSGWDSVTNPLDAELGSNEETDAELKIRRENTLQSAGSATLEAIRARLRNLTGVVAAVGFENENLVPDDQGREPKSYEFVVQGGDEDEICQEIWDSKPGGIKTVGTIVCPIIDSQGFDQEVRFSRPTPVLIYIELDLSVSPEFPSNGIDQVQDALVAFGETLAIGEDVIVFPKTIAALNSITGITDIEIRIGKTASPTTNDNVVVDDNEISDWDTSRIQVNIL